MAANVHSEGTILRRGDRSHPSPWGRTLFLWLPVVLVLGVLVAATVVVGLDLGGQPDPSTEPAAVAPPSGLVLPTPLPAPAPAAAAPVRAPNPAAVRRALAAPLRDAHLGPHVVAIVGSLTSPRAVFSSGAGTVAPASSLKLLTLTAALATLGPSATFDTRVVRGATPRDLVLVGGGDPYLAAKPDPTGASYPPPADLTTLAHRTATALAKAGVATVSLGYDDSLFSGPAFSPHWPAAYRTDSVITPISALWVGRGVLADGLQRSADPSLDAARAFSAALTKAGIRVRSAPAHVRAAAAAPPVASVSSAPVDEIVQEILQVSDNEAAEVMLRHVGLAVSHSGTFTAGVAGVAKTLAGLGVAVSTARLYDGSGLSRDDRVPAQALLDVLRLAGGDAHPELRPLVDGLPVAAFSGSLADRFGVGAEAGRGWVRAKTGTLTGTSALAGFAQDAQGALVPFVFVADQVPTLDTLAARVALDRAAAALAACRCSS